jgi:gliding motility-associated-like protein
MNGGTPPYTYQWTDGSGNVVSTTATLSGIPSGVYNIRVVDARGCVYTAPHEVLEAANAPVQVDTITFVQPTCFGDADGSATAVASGGVGGYSYYWSTNSSTATATGLQASTVYTVTVTDLNGCSDSSTIELTQPDELQLSAVDTIINATCWGLNNGVIVIDTADIEGGVPNFTFSLNGVNFFANNGIFTGLAGRQYYTIYVQDAAGCQAMLPDVYVDGFPELVLTITNDAVLGNPTANEITIELGDSVRAEVIDNTSIPLTYQWQWNPSGNSISCDTCEVAWLTPVFTTLYTVTAVDTNGCSATDNVLVNVSTVRNIFIPNAFTPNGDFLNDVFMVYGSNGVARIDLMTVYDRWGTLVHSATNFQPNDPSFGWNGTLRGRPMNTGAYAYYIEVSFLDGQKRSYKGEVMLLR